MAFVEAARSRHGDCVSRAEAATVGGVEKVGEIEICAYCGADADRGGGGRAADGVSFQPVQPVGDSGDNFADYSGVSLAGGGVGEDRGELAHSTARAAD